MCRRGSGGVSARRTPPSAPVRDHFHCDPEQLHCGLEPKKYEIICQDVLFLALKAIINVPFVLFLFPFFCFSSASK